MKIAKTIKHDEKHIELYVDGLDETMGLLFQELMINNPEIEFVSFTKDHPLLDQIHIVIRTKKKDPFKLFIQAIDTAIKQFTELKSKIKK